MMESRYKAVRTVLFEWDPIGVNGMPGAQDEYNSYVPDVVQLISKNASVEEIFSYLWKLETEHMGLVGNEPLTKEMAWRLMTLREE